MTEISAKFADLEISIKDERKTFDELSPEAVRWLSFLINERLKFAEVMSHLDHEAEETADLPPGVNPPEFPAEGPETPDPLDDRDPGRVLGYA